MGFLMQWKEGWSVCTMYIIKYTIASDSYISNGDILIY